MTKITSLLFVNLTTLKDGAKHELLLMKSSQLFAFWHLSRTYATQLIVTKIVFPKTGAKHELLLNKLASLTRLLGFWPGIKQHN